ncbi:DUF2358 family protein (DUF2358) [Tasmannia lanceolata]|uniref:DUF2358 family protein (DUF2358) n=1 Tax=Tasmannia lanceolata TaxID=3420 RepID=UPI0040633D51
MSLLFSSPEIASLWGIGHGVIGFRHTSKINPRNNNRISFRALSEQKLMISGPRVCSSITDWEIIGSDSNLVPVVRISRYFSAPVQRNSSSSSSLKQKQSEDEDKQNYYVNIGNSIRTLREELPYIFNREPSFDIYRDDIVFKDPLNTFAGIENYKSIFWALRFNGRIFFKALSVDIVSVWQPLENVIMIRWTVHGIPRVPWESHGRFDGISSYKLDKEGKIFEHRVDNIALNSPPKFRVLSVEELVQSIGGTSTPKPTYFEILSSPVLSCSSFILR